MLAAIEMGKKQRVNSCLLGKITTTAQIHGEVRAAWIREAQENSGEVVRFGSNLTVELRLDVSCERGVKDDIEQPKAWSCHLLRWGTWQEK